MAKDKVAEVAAKEETRAVEEWAKEANTPTWALAGLKVRKGWATGKVVTRQEYEKALQDFLSGPMNGR